MVNAYQRKGVELGPLIAAFLMSLTVVLLSELSLAWLVLLFLGIGYVALAFLSGNVKNFLFLGMMVGSSIDINKALINESGIYTADLSITFMDVFFLPLLALWLFEKFLLNREGVQWNKIYLFPFIFIIWCWISVSYAEAPRPAILMCVNYTRYLFIFILIADFIKTPRHLRYALFGLGVGIALHLLLAVLQIITKGAFQIQGSKITTLGTRLVFENAGGLHVFRPSGFLGHPNVLADYLVFVLPVLLTLFLLGIKRIGRLVWLGTTLFFIFGIVALLLTLSRAGWLSFFFAALFILILGYLKGVVSSQLIARLIVLGMVGVMCIIIVFPAALLRLTESDQRSTESRFIMMDQALLIIDRNFLLGVGMSGYNRAANKNIPESFANISTWYQNQLLKGVVHNKYLLVMAELGLIGLVVFLLMLWKFTTVAIRYRHWKDPVYYSVALGLSAGVFGQIIFFVFDHFHADIRLTLLFVYFGLIAAVIKLQETDGDGVIAE